MTPRMLTKNGAQRRVTSCIPEVCVCGNCVRGHSPPTVGGRKNQELHGKGAAMKVFRRELSPQGVESGAERQGDSMKALRRGHSPDRVKGHIGNWPGVRLGSAMGCFVKVRG